ncbi:MAG: hypothetical protein KG012_03345 [Deltaproteobacteria bacterium]|nr:hypothetical protein [Deltaproteobacteria bacterium]
MREIKNEISVIIGRKGQGKTTLASRLIQNIKKVIIIDTLIEYTGSAQINIDEDLIKNLNYFFNNSTEFRLSITPENPAEFEDVINILKRYKNYTLLLDEVGIWSNPSYIPDSLYWILRFGRHSQINQIYAARRPTELNRMMSALADRFYIFNTIEPRDLEYIAKITDSSLINEIKNIKQFNYINYKISEGYDIQSL